MKLPARTPSAIKDSTHEAIVCAAFFAGALLLNGLGACGSPSTNEDGNASTPDAQPAASSGSGDGGNASADDASASTPLMTDAPSGDLDAAGDVGVDAGATADSAPPPAGPPLPTSGSADVWLTTSDMNSLLAKQTPIALSAAGPDGGVATIDIDVTQTFQTVAGFGAAMTDSAAYVLTNDMSATQRQDLMSELFDPAAGVGLDYLRVPMGASDFTSDGSYTYDDVTSGTDPTLAHFSIDHDKAYILPRILDALAINPSLKVMATPWSPPAWMKSNGSLNGGSFNSQYYGAYAQYFVKFIQAYEAAGVPIDMVTLQNEPQNASSTIPSMSLTAAEEADFVATALGPAFMAAGITTKIVVYDHNWNDQFTGQPTTYPQTVFANAQAAPYIAGSAFHGYSGDSSAQIAVHAANPDKDIYFTEYLAGDGEDLEDTFQDIMVDKVIGATRNWARSSVLWNIVLDENDGPQNNGCTDCRGVVTVNSTSGAVTFNPEYYLLGHASKFAFPGSYRVASNTLDGSSITDVAFVNPNGVRALIAMNTGSASATFRVRTATHQFEYSLPAGATATFVWVD